MCIIIERLTSGRIKDKREREKERERKTREGREFSTTIVINLSNKSNERDIEEQIFLYSKKIIDQTIGIKSILLLAIYLFHQNIYKYIKV